MRLLFFASLRDRLGEPGREVSPPDHVTTVAALLEWLRGCDAGFAALQDEKRTIRVAVNQRFATAADPVSPGDEVALFPPVTGG